MKKKNKNKDWKEVQEIYKKLSPEQKRQVNQWLTIHMMFPYLLNKL